MRAHLGRFGLSGHHHLQPICKLSGGQKARVVFTSISLAAPHILLLDEPTNHLDMQSIDALSDALEEVPLPPPHLPEMLLPPATHSPKTVVMMVMMMMMTDSSNNNTTVSNYTEKY